MTAWINGLAIVLASLIVAFVVVMVTIILAPRPDPVRLDLGTIVIPSQVQEDDPGWDCRTMGNLVCGEKG